MSIFGTILGAVAGPIVGGLFQNKANKDNRKEQRDAPRRNLMSQAQGAREASAKYGFNPLTMMEYGQTGATAGGTSAPLASAEMISGAIKDVSDVISGDAARARQREELEIDLARLKIEQARSGVIVLPQSTTDNVGTGLSPLGRNTATYAQATVRSAPPRMSTSAPAPSAKSGATQNTANPIAPDRKRDVAELTNSPGVFEVQNKWTLGKPVTLPGDSEPWGADEVATAVVVGAPQVLYHAGRNEAKARMESDEVKAKQEEFKTLGLPDWYPDFLKPKPKKGSK